MSTLTIHAPAKLNLFLAVTGRRADGFHDLVSVAVTLDFGDRLTLRGETGEGRRETGGEFFLECSDPAVPGDETNLVLKAARAFAAATGWRGAAEFSLEKRIPMGAGLGGGSSDAAAALQALNQLTGNLLDAGRLREVAAGVGSDCALFLHEGPVVMRGRGERVEALPPAASARLRGRRVMVFKPEFGIATAWAYGRMAAEPANYVAAAEAEERLAVWSGSEGVGAEGLLFNNMERVAFAKFVALPVLLDELRARFGLAPRMSGSGSACFAFLPGDAPVGEITGTIRRAWGESACVQEARIL